MALVEQIRLGLTADVPLVSQQWNAIIAVNYAARKFGITRLHHNIFDAKQLCPELVCAHVATLGPGDSKPDYYPSPSRYTHKVSLDPYRKASAKIFNVFRRFAPKFQKGGLDEVFMDVTDIVNRRIMDRYGDDLSKWDYDSAEMIDWKRDHSDLGVVFGTPRDGDSNEGTGGTGYPDDDDEDMDESLDGIQTDENEHDMESDNEVGPDIGHGNGIGPEDDQALEDDFDFGLEQYLDSDFDDVSAIAQSNEGLENNGEPFDMTAKTSGAATPQAQTPVHASGHEATLPIEEKSEEELRRSKEAEEERFRREKEQLLPYYGIPEGTFEEEFWAEMQLLVAAEFSKEVRYAVREELGYTCSAGIANNRLLAKLGSGMNKPFQQTIVLPKFIPDLLHGIKLSNIRNLGGKFGKQVREDYNIERASQLWPVPLRQLQERYGDQAGLELWQWCRGIDHVGVRKIKSKSMCSHKSFIPALSDLEEIQFWITSMSLELESRMQAEYDETERWPRTVSLGFFGGRRAQQDQMTQERKSSFRAPYKGSRSMPLGSRFEYGGVEGIARKVNGLLEKLIKESESGRGRPVLPLILLTITVSNFSEGHESAMGDITKFFSKTSSLPQQPHKQTPPEQQHWDEASGDKEQQTTQVANTEEKTDKTTTVTSSESRITDARRRFFQPRTTAKEIEGVSARSLPIPESPRLSPTLEYREKDVSKRPTRTLICEQCPSPGQHILIEEWEQHTDYHFALSLLEDDSNSNSNSNKTKTKTKKASIVTTKDQQAAPSAVRLLPYIEESARKQSHHSNLYFVK
ncbi:DNA-directed DNA polymerase eta rad30 [Gamsiella multidivaricata]|nr:DNA-directed DNA polymerase eta rad30 [Gamsiella multidivaricata]